MAAHDHKMPNNLRYQAQPFLCDVKYSEVIQAKKCVNEVAYSWSGDKIGWADLLVLRATTCG
jgi:hypothetical protein